MPNQYNLATPLANNRNMQAFVQVFREEIERIDPTRFLVFLFDTADEALLDLLAAQFDMLGFNGWILADTVQAKRELLKGSFELHALKGTPGGIREVITRLGFLGARIEEGWENFTDGSAEPDINPWAYFRVVYDVPENRAINQQTFLNLKGLIENYKNARSVLSDISLNLPTKDYLSMRGEVMIRTIRVSDDVVLSEETTSNWINPAVYMSFMLDPVRGIKGVDSPGAEESTVISSMRFQKIAFGTSGTVQQPDDFTEEFTITAPFKKLLDLNPSQININTLRSVAFRDAKGYGLRHFFSLGAGEANGKVIRELGLIMEGLDNGAADQQVREKIIARVVRSPLTKTADVRIEGTWDIYFTFNTPV